MQYKGVISEVIVTEHSVFSHFSTLCENNIKKKKKKKKKKKTSQFDFKAFNGTQKCKKPIYMKEKKTKKQKTK